jgi:hypothetical protein
VKPLLRKDAPWLLAFGLGGLAFALSVQGTSEGPWIRPDSKFAEIGLAFHWVAATLLGLVAALVDDLTRTREYLQHRSLSRARIFWTRHIAGLVVVASWVVLVPALHLLATLIWREDRFLVEPQRYWRLVDEGAPGFVFFAVGVFSGTIVRRVVWALPLAAAASGGVLLLFLPRVASNMGFLTTVPAFLLALPLTVAFLLAALLSERDGREGDRPWARGRLLTAGALLLALAVPGSSFLLGALEQGTVEELFDAYPHLGQRNNGENVRHVDGTKRRQLLAVDESHAVIGELRPDDLKHDWNPERILNPFKPITFGTVAQHGRFFDGRFTRGYSCPGELNCYLSSDGYVELVREIPRGADDEGEPIRVRAGLPPDNQPFPGHVMPVGHWWAGTAFLADFEAGVLWSADLMSVEPRFVPLPLPNNDRLHHDLTYDVVQSWRIRNVQPPLLVVAGDNAIYTVNEGAQLVPAPPVIAEVGERAVQDRKLDVAVTNPTATSFTAAVNWGDGSPVARHHFSPHTLIERGLAATVYATALVRPTAFALASLPFPVKAKRKPAPSWVLGAYVRSMSFVVVAANLVLSLLLAAWLWRRLTSYGASPARVWTWTLLVFLGGVPAFICARLIETRRAWQPAVPAATEPARAPVLLIQTA